MPMTAGATRRTRPPARSTHQRRTAGTSAITPRPPGSAAKCGADRADHIGRDVIVRVIELTFYLAVHNGVQPLPALQLAMPRRSDETKGSPCRTATKGRAWNAGRYARHSSLQKRWRRGRSRAPRKPGLSYPRGVLRHLERAVSARGRSGCWRRLSVVGKALDRNCGVPESAAAAVFGLHQTEIRADRGLTRIALPRRSVNS